MAVAAASTGTAGAAKGLTEAIELQEEKMVVFGAGFSTRKRRLQGVKARQERASEMWEPADVGLRPGKGPERRRSKRENWIVFQSFFLSLLKEKRTPLPLPPLAFPRSGPWETRSANAASTCPTTRKESIIYASTKRAEEKKQKNSESKKERASFLSVNKVEGAVFLCHPASLFRGCVCLFSSQFS